MAQCELCQVESGPDHEQSLRHVLSKYLSEGKFRTARPDGLIVKYLAALAALYPEAFDTETKG